MSDEAKMAAAALRAVRLPALLDREAGLVRQLAELADQGQGERRQRLGLVYSKRRQEQNGLVDAAAAAMAAALAVLDAQAAELERLRPLHGHDAPCYFCGKPCDSWAGNPGLWPVALCHADKPGVVKWHHTGCVEELTRAQAAETERADAAERLCVALADRIEPGIMIAPLTSEERATVAAMRANQERKT